MRYSTYSNKGGTGDTDSSEVPNRRGKGTFHSGTIPPPFTHRIYRSGVGWVPADKSGASSLVRAASSPGTGIGRGQDSSFSRSKV